MLSIARSSEINLNHITRWSYARLPWKIVCGGGVSGRRNSSKRGKTLKTTSRQLRFRDFPRSLLLGARVCKSGESLKWETRRLSWVTRYRRSAKSCLHGEWHRSSWRLRRLGKWWRIGWECTALGGVCSRDGVRITEMAARLNGLLCLGSLRLT